MECREEAATVEALAHLPRRASAVLQMQWIEAATFEWLFPLRKSHLA
jgi:hypothetical protein